MKRPVHSQLCIIIVCFLLMLFNPVKAREISEADDSMTPNLFLGFGTGINSVGYGGLVVEIPIVNKISLSGSAGLGTWGAKLRGYANVYTSQVGYKSSWSFGLTRSTGMDNMPINLYVENHDEQQAVTLNLKPITTFDIVYAYNMKVGRSSKVRFSAGYSFRTTSNNYTVERYTLTDESEYVMKLIQPGGLMLGLAFLFGL